MLNSYILAIASLYRVKVLLGISKTQAFTFSHQFSSPNRSESKTDQ